MLKLVEYPKYKREEKLCAKLSLQEITLIKRKYATGKFTQRDLARIYSVCQYTIWYVLLPEEKRKEHNKEYYIRKGSLKERHGKEYIKEVSKRFRKRKNNVFDIIYRKWCTYYTQLHRRR